MNTKMKTVWVIVTIFLLGLVIGALGSHLFYRYKVNQIVSMRSPQNIFRFVERVIGPTPKQRQPLHDILQKHGRKILENQRENRENQLLLFQALKDELASILSPEQMQRLETHLQRRQRPLRQAPAHWENPERRPRDGQKRRKI